jgi:hypothetical protein
VRISAVFLVLLAAHQVYAQAPQGGPQPAPTATPVNEQPAPAPSSPTPVPRSGLGEKPEPDVFVCVGARPPGIPGMMRTERSETPLFDDCDTFGSDGQPARVTTSLVYSDAVVGAPSQYILVRLSEDEQTPLRLDTRNDIQEVVISAGDVTIAKVAHKSLNVSKSTVVVPLDELRVLDNQALVTVRVDFNSLAGKPPRASHIGYFRLKNSASLYGLAKSGTGFWLPVGLFATDFKNTQDGISLAAFPVGLAWGVRFYLPGKSQYIGTSAAVNWAIYRAPSDMTMPGDSQGFSLQSAAVGVLADLSGYAYVGGAYIADFREGQSSPGWVFVVGAGPQLLQFLQSAKQ